MLIHIVHKESSKFVRVDTEDTNDKTRIIGNPELKKALLEFLQTFESSYAFKDEIESAKEEFGEILVKAGKLYSIDQTNPDFYRLFVIPALTEQGYACEIIDTEI